AANATSVTLPAIATSDDGDTEATEYFTVELSNVTNVAGAGNSLIGQATIEDNDSAPVGSVIFVTSTTHTGNLGGLAGADAICQTRAAAGGLSNSALFKAIMSDATANAVDRLAVSYPVQNTQNEDVELSNLWDGVIDGDVEFDE